MVSQVSQVSEESQESQVSKLWKVVVWWFMEFKEKAGIHSHVQRDRQTDRKTDRQTEREGRNGLGSFH